MFQKKSWLFLALVFGLMVLAFFLPFERIAANKLWMFSKASGAMSSSSERLSV